MKDSGKSVDDGYVPDLEKDEIRTGNRPIDDKYLVPQTSLAPEEQASPSSLLAVSGRKEGGVVPQPSPEDLLMMEGKKDGGVIPGPLPEELNDTEGVRDENFYREKASSAMFFLRDPRFGFTESFIRKMLMVGTLHAAGAIDKPEFVDDPINGIKLTPDQKAKIRSSAVEIDEAIISLRSSIHELYSDLDDYLKNEFHFDDSEW